jgi:hypothetical protein
MGRFTTIPGKKYRGEVHKKSEAPVEPVFRFYGRFLMGFLEKAGVERGFLMVNLWWMRGESWSERWCFFETKNMPHFENIFVGIAGGMSHG